MMRTLLIAVATVLASAFLTGINKAEQPIDFTPQPDFFQLPDSITLAECSAVSINSKGEIFLFHRGPQPIICLDGSGKFLRSWGDGVIHTAHGLRIDAEDNVWITDIGNHQVMKFNSEGKLLMALGKAGKAGNGIDEFNKPTDIAFGPNGEIYVSDGYGNSRVIKFTPNGGYLASWGRSGRAANQFNLPHSIIIDDTGRILVGDRENDRIQVFNEDGKLLKIWKGYAPYGLALDKQGKLFVADGRANKILQLNDKGAVVASWGRTGPAPGEFQMPHMLATDADGNLFISEITGKRFQKLARKKP